MSNLIPGTWIKCKLGDVVATVRGVTFPASSKVHEPTDGYVACLRTSHIQEKLLWNNIYYIPSSYVKGTDRLAKRNDILMSMANSSNLVGKVCIKETDQEACFGAFLSAIRSEGVSHAYIYYFLKSSKAQQSLRSSASQTVNIANISVAALEQLPLPLAPLPEQTRIAAKLDELLAQMDTLKARIDTIPALLKRFRHSVLDAAVSGRLTKEWRNGSVAKWDTLTLADIIDGKPRNGYSPKPVAYETAIKTLSLSATTSGVFKGEHFKYVDEAISRDSHLWLYPGDILIQRANTLEYVGVSAIYDGEPMSHIYPDLMMKCRPKEGVLTEYLHMCLSSRAVRKHFRDNATGTAGNMPKINQQTVMSAPVLLAPLSEQTEIIRRVEQLFVFVDQLEARVKAAQARIDGLTQSILAKAFRGELVPQDPNDEPASVLLERIKAQRAATPKTKRGRRAATFD
ncbi:hypothetical protein AO069_11405 [Pseudomonas syringae pv. syringae PD2774]|uniref:restriction endonuclease subunit S n=1 Tax=Pseudomonas syringae TaxID=317 RepID=UPI000737A2D9|nr:restriction endonuclease subunit S [Pseudomonas syringae]KTB92563.1 hypothetical protein AO069_11405 [Pseudomonas syringae pv. syringae PD2774]